MSQKDHIISPIDETRSLEANSIPLTPSYLVQDPSYFSSIDHPSQSNPTSINLIHTTPHESKSTVGRSKFQKRDNRSKLVKYPAQSQPSSLQQLLEKSESRENSSVSAVKPIDMYVLRVKQILDDAKHLQRDGNYNSARIQSDLNINQYVAGGQSARTSKIDCLKDFKFIPDIRRSSKEPDAVSESACTTTLNLSRLKGSEVKDILDCEESSRGLQPSYWQNTTIQKSRDESYPLSPKALENKREKSKFQRKIATISAEKNTLERSAFELQSNNEDKRSEPLKSRKETKIKKNLPRNADSLQVKRNGSTPIIDDFILNEYHVKPYQGKRNISSLESSFIQEINRQRNKEGSNEGSRNEVLLKNPTAFLEIDPENERIKELSKLYAGKKCLFINKNQTEKKCEEKNHDVPNHKPISIILAKDKQIIHPAYMKHKGTMCYTELWSSKEVSNVSKKINTKPIDLRHYNRENEALYRPLKWQNQQSFIRKIRVDEKDSRFPPSQSLVKQVSQLEEGKKLQRCPRLETLRGVKVLSRSKRNILETSELERTPLLPPLRRNSQSLVKSRDGSPVSPFRTERLDASPTETMQPQNFFSQGIIAEELTERSRNYSSSNLKFGDLKIALKPLKSRTHKPFKDLTSGDRLAVFHNFLKEDSNQYKDSETGVNLRRMVSEIVRKNYSSMNNKR